MNRTPFRWHYFFELRQRIWFRSLISIDQIRLRCAQDWSNASPKMIRSIDRLSKIRNKVNEFCREMKIEPVQLIHCPAKKIRRCYLGQSVSVNWILTQPQQKKKHFRTAKKKREINVHIIAWYFFVCTISRVRITESSCVSINLILTQRLRPRTKKSETKKRER